MNALGSVRGAKKEGHVMSCPHAGFKVTSLSAKELSVALSSPNLSTALFVSVSFLSQMGKNTRISFARSYEFTPIRIFERHPRVSGQSVSRSLLVVGTDLDLSLLQLQQRPHIRSTIDIRSISLQLKRSASVGEKEKEGSFFASRWGGCHSLL